MVTKRRKEFAEKYWEKLRAGATPSEELWTSTAIEAGYQRPPLYGKRQILELVEALEAEAKEAAEVEAVLEGIDFANIKDWKALADRIMPIYVKIAGGTVRATPGQVRVLESIFNRGYGKGMQQEVPEPKLVVLPVLGAGEVADTFICPECYKRFTGSELREYFHLQTSASSPIGVGLRRSKAS